MDNDNEYGQLIQERFKLLPKVVQDAITSADVEQHLRELANTHKLHLDQWETLENQVMLTLLGVENSEDLQKNIQTEVNVDAETAKTLTADISRIVFEPIRQELERQLEHPEAKVEAVSDVEAARTQVLAAEPKPATPPIAPATPPAAGPTKKVERTPISESYKAGETSASRTSVHDDPYREPPA